MASKDNDSWAKKAGEWLGGGSKNFLSGLWSGAAPDPKNPRNPQQPQNPSTPTMPDITSLFSQNTNPSAPDQGNGPLPAIIGGVLTSAFANWLTWSLPAGWMGRMAITSISGALGAWLSNMLVSQFTGSSTPPAPDASSTAVVLKNGDPTGREPKKPLPPLEELVPVGP